jgi:hypothetical protein
VCGALVGGALELATAASACSRPLPTRPDEWILSAQGPAGVPLAERIRAGARTAAHGGRHGRDPRPPRDRALQAALRLGAGGRRPPAGAEIADAAGVALGRFMDMFEDGRSCYAQACSEAARGALATAAAGAARAPQWPRRVRPALDALLARLARRPADARAIALRVAGPVPGAGDPTALLMTQLARLLLGGAPADTRTRGAQVAVAGALWHSIAVHTAAGRTRLLPMLAPELAYVVLAPALGPHAAAAAAAAGGVTAAGAGG